MSQYAVPSTAAPVDLHRSTRRGALAVTAGVLASAGVVHLQYAPEHMMEWAGFGLAFYAMGIAQLAGAAAVLAGIRSNAARSAAIWGNLAIALVWLLSRTVGLPVGPEPWHHEALGAADMLCTVAEVWVALVMTALVPRYAPAAEPGPQVEAGVEAGVDVEIQPAFSA
jgi:hypothetical protein